MRIRIPAPTRRLAARTPRTPLVTPAGRALLAASVSVYGTGIILGYPELVAVAAGGLLLLALAAVTVLVPPRLAVERTFQPQRVTVSDAVLGLLTVTNQSRWPSPPVVVVDHLTDRGRSQRIPLRVGMIAGHGTRTVRYPIPALRRGRWELGPVTVERRDPLGLFRRGQPHRCAGTLWVHPRVHRAVSLPLGKLLDYEGATTLGAPKGAVSFSSLREYVPGDDPRQVHWKSTARTGTLMVREHVDTSQPTVTVLLDTSAAAWAGDERFEQAAEVAASLIVAVRRSGRPVALHVHGEDRERTARAGALGPLDRLAAATPATAEAPSGLALLAERARAGGILVVVTGPDAAGAVTELATQRRRFTLLILIHVGGDAPLATNTFAGMVIIRAAAATSAVGAWNGLAHSGRAVEGRA